MKRFVLKVISVFLCIGMIFPFFTNAENQSGAPKEFDNLLTISGGNKTFGIDAKTGLGKLFDAKTQTVWAQYYASPTVGTENIPIRFDDTSAWNITEGSTEIGGENKVTFLLDWMEHDGELSSVFPGEKIYVGNYRLKIEYYTEKAKGFDFQAGVNIWRNNINSEDNGNWWLNSVSGEKKSCENGIADGKHEYTVDIPQSAFKDHTGSCSVSVNLKRYDGAKGKVIINSVGLIGQNTANAPITVSGVKKIGNTIELGVNSIYREIKGLSPIDCIISFDKNGALKYSFKADKDMEFNGELHYPPTFYNDSDNLKWILPKDSGLLLSAVDLQSYTNKRLKLAEFYNAGGLDMAFFGGVDAKAGCGYFAVIDTPINAGVLYPQSQIGKKQGFLPVISLFEDKDKWKEDRQVRFFFTDNGSYVNIAKKYREIAKEKGFVKTYKEKSGANPQIAQTAFAHRVDLAIDVRATMNYFDKLADAGINNVMTRVADVRDTAQNALNVDLQSLIKTGIFKKIKERYPDAMLYEYLNPRDIYLETGEHELDEDLAEYAEPYLLEGSTGKTFTGWEDTFGVKAYIACPEFYLKYLQYRMNKFPLSVYPTTIKFVDILGTCSLGEGVCYSDAHPSDRTELYNTKKQMLQAIIDLGADAHTEGAAEYMVPYSTSFEGSLGFMNIPGMYSSGADMLDSDHGVAADYERIPFWQLVFHDCAGTYWHWEFGNLEYEKRNNYCDLFSLLYGEKGMFLPSYTSSYPGTSFFAAMLERINKLNSVFLRVATDEMTDHTFLTADGKVQKTVFSSGISVIVNFSEDNEYKNDGITVGPWNFAVLDKGGKLIEEKQSEKTPESENEQTPIKETVKTITDNKVLLIPKYGAAAAIGGLLIAAALTVSGILIYRKRRKKI